MTWFRFNGFFSAPDLKEARDTPARRHETRESRAEMQDARAPQKSVLQFSGLLVVVGGGLLDLDLLHRLSARGADLVGADGGGDVIAEAGLVPRAIIGDFDSLADPHGWTEETTLLRIEEQETTDFEKVLYSTSAPLTVALGMTGRRFDHTLAALNAVARHAGERRIVLVDEYDLALAVSGRFSFALPRGQRVSVHPLGRVAFRRSEGLLYPLDGLVLDPAGRIGTSNEATADSISIEPEPASDLPYLVIMDRQHLERLLTGLHRS